MKKLTVWKKVSIGAVAVAIGVASTSIGAVALVGQTSDPAPSPYESEFVMAQASATSSFERSVLADATITADEYQQASAAYVECLKGQGWSVSLVPTGPMNGLEVLGRAEGEKWDKAVELCRTGTVALIEPLYAAVTLNPEKTNPVLRILNCLREGGYVDETFTAEDLVKYSGERSKDGPWLKDPASVECFTA